MLFSFSPAYLKAQVPEMGNWLVYVGNQNFGNNKWVFHNEIQYRSYNFLGNQEQLLLRTGVGKYLTDKNNLLTIGYAFINSRPLTEVNSVIEINEAGEFRENRIWQQFLTKQNIGRVVLLHRYRFEQRFIENQSFKLRLRYFLGANIPISKPTMGENTYYLSFYNEVFLNTETESNAAIFDRNRLYGAIGYQVNSGLKLEIGMMRQGVNNSNFSRNQLQFVVFNNLPFRKP